MAHKTFISYKYSEAQNLRDRIIKALGDDASYYKGETSDSPDLTDTSTENIKKNLKDMMYDTSVTIVVISPHIKVSIRPRACFFPLFSFLPLWLHYNLNPLCVQY